MKMRKSIQRHPAVSVLVACGVSIGVTLLGAIVSAVILNREMIGEEQISYAVMVITGVSALAGAAAACRNGDKNRMILSLSAGGGYFCLLLLTGLIIGELGEGIGVTGLLIIGCSACAALAGGRKKPVKYTAAAKYRNR